MKPLFEPQSRILSPGYGVPSIDWSHPLTRGLTCFFAPIYGNVNLVTGILPLTTTKSWWSVPFQSTAYGPALQLRSSDSTVSNVELGSTAQLFSSNATTCMVIRRANSVSTSNTFGHDNATNAQIVSAWFPYSDGNIYWEYGGNSGANLLTFNTTGVVTVGATAPAYVYVLHAGAAGSAVFIDGVKRVSQGTGISATLSTANTFGIFYNAKDALVTAATIATVAAATWNRQLSDAEIYSLSAQPFQFLKFDDPLYVAISNAISTIITPSSASLVLSEDAPTVTLTNRVILSPDAANLALAEDTPTVAVTSRISLFPNQADLKLSEDAPTDFTTNRKDLSPTAATLALAEDAPTAALDSPNIIVASGSLLLTEAAPTLTTTNSNPNLSPTVTSLHLTEAAPTLSIAAASRNLSPTVASLHLTEAAPAINIFTPSATNITVLVASLRLAGGTLATTAAQGGTSVVTPGNTITVPTPPPILAPTPIIPPSAPHL